MRQITQFSLFAILVLVCHGKSVEKDSLPVLFGLLSNRLANGEGRGTWFSAESFDHIRARNGRIAILPTGNINRGYIGRAEDSEFAGAWGIDFFIDLPNPGPTGSCMVVIFTRDRIEPFQCEIGFKDKACGSHIQCELANSDAGAINFWATNGKVKFSKLTHGIKGKLIEFEFDISKENTFRLNGKAKFAIETTSYYPKDYSPEKYTVPEPKLKAVPLNGK